MKWREPNNIGRFQICPGVAKQHDAGLMVERSAFNISAQDMQRCSFPILIDIINCIWRHIFRKQPPERLDVSVACGIVYGCHRVRPREQLPEEGRIGSPGELKGTLGCEARAGQTTREQLLRVSKESGLRGAIYGQRSEDEQPETTQ